VELHTLASAAKPALWRAYVLPAGTGPSNTIATPDAVDITLVLTDETAAGPVEFTLAFDGDAGGASMKGTAVAGVVSVEKVPVPNPTLWSTKNPVRCLRGWVGRCAGAACRTGRQAPACDRHSLRSDPIRSARIWLLFS
jgi:hypothetical protein